MAPKSVIKLFILLFSVQSYACIDITELDDLDTILGLTNIASIDCSDEKQNCETCLTLPRPQNFSKDPDLEKRKLQQSLLVEHRSLAIDFLDYAQYLKKDDDKSAFKACQLKSVGSYPEVNELVRIRFF